MQSPGTVPVAKNRDPGQVLAMYPKTVVCQPRSRLKGSRSVAEARAFSRWGRTRSEGVKIREGVDGLRRDHGFAASRTKVDHVFGPNETERVHPEASESAKQAVQMIFANALRDESLPGITGEILRPGRRRYKDVHAAFYQLASFPVAAVQEIPSPAHAEDRHDVMKAVSVSGPSVKAE